MNDQSRAWLEQLSQEALKHRAINHPYLVQFSNASLPDFRYAVADFAQQYSLYSSRFVNLLTAVISKLTDQKHRNILLDNLSEESGYYAENELQELHSHGIDPSWVRGIPHAELFNRFREKATRDIAEIPVSDDAAIWYDMLSAVLLYGSTEEAIGALGLGTEHVVSSIYPFIEKGLKQIPEISPEDYCFFSVHTLIDDHHAESLNQIALDFANTEMGRKRLHYGVLKSLNLRAAFWDGLLDRAHKNKKNNSNNHKVSIDQKTGVAQDEPTSIN
ncbi:iron-containing redox enzyme family protein [uncultured Microbulbifer sp.]|uniref:iron-containing redox enzyme family protein n=1 Tax=uncultured Microbulbifer sp. TaxID=348147 RepID=UPI00260C66BB|nr:iron-containing redox enzyme family protein [uncultured Microbulbifer sp.]